jgi:diguanylate cyclase (GGDEF)-like protein
MASITELQRRHVLVEVERRAFTGVFVHLPAWLLVVASSGIYRQHIALTGMIALAHLLIAAARTVLHKRFTALVELRFPQARALFLGLLLGSSTLWGAALAASLWWQPLMPAHETLRLVVLVICAAGTMTFAIMPSVRICMPVAMVGPYVVALLANIDHETAFLALLAVLFLRYITTASRSVGSDYWAATNAHLLLEQRAVELERLSITDGLTQLHNRQHFDRRIGEEWIRAQRSADDLTVLMIDLDHFKKINDTRGHPFGDRCLKAVAAALQGVLYRAGDLLARYGGEEFVVLLPGTDANAALTVAERMRLSVANLELATEQGRVHLSCSIGAATVLPSPRSGWMVLLGQADASLYVAKQRGRNRVAAYEATGEGAAVLSGVGGKLV